MGTVYLRSNTWWIGFVDAGGKWHYKSAKTHLESEARGTLAEIEEAVAQGQRVAAGPQTLAAYAIAWCAERGGRRDEEKVWTAGTELGRLKEHVFPMLGGKRLGEVRPRDVRELVATLKVKRSRMTGQTLAARTIRNVYGVVHALFEDAVADELIDVSPCTLKSGDMPGIVDKDPEWRDDAEFTRAEVEQLITDDRIPFNRRVWWALGFLTGMRTGEICALRWRHIDSAETPLGVIKVVGSYNAVHKRVKSTKTKRPRRVPIHPVLAAVLAEWKLTGWAELNGRAPAADDLVVTNERGGYLSDSSTKKTRPRDLVKLGLRVRRFHDARSTFITLGTSDGADEIWLERVTHNAKGSVFNQYRRASWVKMCEAVSCLRIQRRGAAPVVLNRWAAASLQDVLQTEGAIVEDAEITPEVGVRSEGFEPTDSGSAGSDSAASADGSDDDDHQRERQNGAKRRNVGRTADQASRARILLLKFAGGAR